MTHKNCHMKIFFQEDINSLSSQLSTMSHAFLIAYIVYIGNHNGSTYSTLAVPTTALPIPPPFPVFINPPPLPLQAENFHPEYHTLGTMLVSATLQVYKEAMRNLLPTPAKSHYVFNLRDFARVVLGCLLVKPQSLESKKTFIRLWVHEVYRVYYDRLVDGKDRQWVFELLQVSWL